MPNLQRLLFLLIFSAAAGCASAGTDSVDARVGGPDAAAASDAAANADGALPAVDAAIADADTAADAAIADAAAGADGGGGAVCIAAMAQPDNDSCGVAIDLTTDALTPGGATIAGDTTGYTDQLQPPSACTDGFLLDGADAAYRVTATAGQTITATVTPETWDTSIYILSSCSPAKPATGCLVGADAIAGDGAESVSFAVIQSGTYYVIVDGWNPNVEGCYTLNVQLN